jgi:hypothetical protein
MDVRYLSCRQEARKLARHHRLRASRRGGSTSTPRDLVWLRRVRIDREYAQPLDVEALARGAHMSVTQTDQDWRSADQRPAARVTVMNMNRVNMTHDIRR